MSSPAERLRTSVVEPLKRRFVGRDEVVDLIALAVVAGEHLFLYGPPGTAKSAIVRQFATAVRGEYFEYMLTKFSEPNEIFGPVDLVKLREGRVATVITQMLPEAEFAFLDELFNANSAILNNLLTVLNERVYRRGAETHALPLISAFAASNNLPQDDALAALFDRFLLRCQVESLPREQLPALLTAGWALEGGAAGEPAARTVSADDLRALAAESRRVELAPVLAAYADAVTKLRDLGVALSDRRAVKLLKLVAASAVLCGRDTAGVADFWPLKYAWDRVEQVGPIASQINGLIDATPATDGVTHPRAGRREAVEPEALALELEAATADAVGATKLLEVARLRERVQSVSDRAAWVTDATARAHLLKSAAELLGRIE